MMTSSFRAETVVNGLRVEDYKRVRLSDGKQFKDDANSDAEKPGQVYGGPKSQQTRPFVLPSLLDIAFVVDKQVEKRRLVIEGLSPEYLRWRYEFNLLLLDPQDYPHVSEQLDTHIETLKEIARTVKDAGASYVLFHTNSFRLPGDRPLVRRLNAFFASMPEFQGRFAGAGPAPVRPALEYGQ